MQGSPFDDSDFPPPSAGLSSTWMEPSPRVVASTPPNVSANVTEEELYRIVGAPPPSSAPLHHPNSHIMQRFTQQMSAMTSTSVPLYSNLQQQQSLAPHFSPPQPQDLSQHQHHSQHRHHSQSNVSPPLQVASPQRPQRHRPASISAGISNASNTRYFLRNKGMSHHVAATSTRRQRAPRQEPLHEPEIEQVNPLPASPPDLEPHALESTSQELPYNHSPSLVASSEILAADTSDTAVRASTLQHDKAMKSVRSAVEEARLRAQREAESYANSRRDPAKRDSGLGGGNSSNSVGREGSGDGRPVKRSRHSADTNVAEGSSSRKRSRATSDEKGKTEEDSEVEKQERYKRRLDMNRESAAVSRVRRRAYVKELEERLAAVEAEKFQLEGKLEIMQSQNESFKKQLDDLFMMVASGRRPQYPPPSQEPPP